MSGHASHSSHGSHGHSQAGVGYELSDASFKKAVWIIPLSLVILAVFSLICYFYTSSGLTREMTLKQTSGAEVDNKKLEAFETKEDQSMHQYQLSKTNKGMAQIPIERAMEMMVKDNGSSTGGAPAKAK